MIEINAETLKYAYKKLKYYIYYYKSLNYLKDIIYKFEDEFSNDIDKFNDYFEKLSFEFNSIKSNDNLSKKENYKLNFDVYPKKDAIVDRGNDNYIVTDVNLFIKMNLKMYLVDILFALSIYDNISKNYNRNLAYGNMFSRYLDENIVNSPFLFENHRIKYKQWRNCIYSELDKFDANRGLIIKIDMKRCFYNFRFNFKKFTEDIGVINDIIIIIERYIYNYYTEIVNNFFQKKENFEKNECLLPIGLLSSYCIMNYFFQTIDEKFINNKYVFNYGRYVDDILILAKFSRNNNSTSIDILSDYFDEIFNFGSEDVSIKKSITNLTKDIPINKKKLKTKIVSIEKLKQKKEDLREFHNASIEDEERESGIELNVEGISKIKYYLYNNDISLESKIQKIFDLEDVESLNSYPLWKNIFSIMPTQDKVLELKDEIQKSIAKIKYESEVFKVEKIENKIKKTLQQELETALQLVVNEKYKKYFISDISQKLKFHYIENCLKETKIFQRKLKYTFPIVITKESLMLYYSLENLDNYSISMLSNNYKKINGIDLPKLDIGFKEVNDNIVIIYTVDKIDSLLSKRRELSKEKFENKVKISIVNLNIDEKEMDNYDLDDCKYPESYSYDTIRKIIVNSSKHGSKYVLFPELSIPYDEADKIISLAKDNEISIIFGVTHKLYVIDEGKERRIRTKDIDMYDIVYAKNITIIYDYHIGIIRKYVKQNLAPKEREFLLKNKIYGVNSINRKEVFYSLINYGVMVCFDATDIKFRATYKDYVDTLFIPVMNKDTEYYSAIIKSLSRDLNAYVVQSNINKYGDSRITGPFHYYDSDIVKTKGGINNYFVVADLDYGPLKNRILHDNIVADYYKELDELKLTDGSIKTFFEKSSETDKKMSKPLSANSNLDKMKNIGKIQGILDIEDENL